jgi:hypothetical protein
MSWFEVLLVALLSLILVSIWSLTSWFRHLMQVLRQLVEPTSTAAERINRQLTWVLHLDERYSEKMVLYAKHGEFAGCTACWERAFYERYKENAALAEYIDGVALKMLQMGMSEQEVKTEQAKLWAKARELQETDRQSAGSAACD